MVSPPYELFQLLEEVMTLTRMGIAKFLTDQHEDRVLEAYGQNWQIPTWTARAHHSTTVSGRTALHVPAKHVFEQVAE